MVSGERWIRRFAAVMNDHMKQQIGTLLQFLVLVFLPALVVWQLTFGFPLIVMPALTLAGIVVFWIGYRLRES